MEGEPVLDDDSVVEAVSKTLGVALDRRDIRFLYELQYAHDVAREEEGDPFLANLNLEHFFMDWENQLRETCERYKLRFPEELL